MKSKKIENCSARIATALIASMVIIAFTVFAYSIDGIANSTDAFMAKDPTGNKQGRSHDGSSMGSVACDYCNGPSPYAPYP
jgi:hypothetical protein